MLVLLVSFFLTSSRGLPPFGLFFFLSVLQVANIRITVYMTGSVLELLQLA
jgi:hypothetical protein